MTDLVDYNLDVLNLNDLRNSFFHTSKDDPTCGFAFDASCVAGHVYPATDGPVAISPSKDLDMRLCLGSHLAMHMRHQLEHEKGFTSTVGISTNKLLSKLVGNLNKPKGQTTLFPPYSTDDEKDSNVIHFMDQHDIGKVPNIGFKMAQKLREHVLQRPADFDTGLVYGGTREKVTVRDVRLHSEVCSERLEELLSGPGAPHGIGFRTWSLLWGVDDTEVGLARSVPRQISIEDSYLRLDTLPEVTRELNTLSRSLLTRMRIDLLTTDDDNNDDTTINTFDSSNGAIPPNDKAIKRTKWLAQPKTIRLSTRLKPPLNADGTRARTFKRTSHSAPLPTFVFNSHDAVDALAHKLVHDTLLPMFRRLHPDARGWNLTLVNVAVTNMVEAAGEGRAASGRDIGRMFRRQEDVLRDFRVIEEDEVRAVGAPPVDEAAPDRDMESLAAGKETDEFDELTAWVPDGNRDRDVEDDFQQDEGSPEEEVQDAVACSTCGLLLPAFALVAHERYHELGD